ncbi:MAG: hypothetical protein M1821_003122 [Bathelium mastoideum]|nr:MAG: hypothetical protein M1821_003122 [Bathelium mastoideum]KAI9688198.1 MAG: hypothetical protein M1822_001704 [Bathelium mastoideum]
MAAIGCWLAILSLLFDPFAQQIISYEQEMVFTKTEEARVPFASRWSAAQTQLSFIGLLQQPVQAWGDVLSGLKTHINFTTQAAIASGISDTSSEISQHLSVECSSGNCRWAPYSSLAVCSACNDVSQPFVSGNASGWPDQASWFQDPKGVVGGANITWFKLPGNGLNMNNPNNYAFSNGSTERITMSGQVNRDPNKSISFTNSSTLLFSMAVMWADLDKDYTYSNWPTTNFTARECGLYLCVKEFQSSVVNGTLNEMARETASTRDASSYQVVGSPPQPSLKIESLYDSNASVTRSDLRIQAPNNAQFKNVSISQAGVRGLIWYVKHAFDDGSMWAKVPDLETRTITWSQLMPNITGLVRLIPGTQTFQYLPDVMQVLWTAKNTDSGIDGVFSNLASSLTNNIRTTSDGNAAFSGEEGTSVTFVRVRWLWIILPGATVLLAAAFLALTIWQTRSSKTPTWKSGTMAILFHGLSSGLKRSLPRYQLQSEMEKVALGINVRLMDESKDGIVLDGTALIHEEVQSDEIEKNKHSDEPT